MDSPPTYRILFPQPESVLLISLRSFSDGGTFTPRLIRALNVGHDKIGILVFTERYTEIVWKR